MSNMDPFNPMPGAGWNHNDRPLPQGSGSSAWVLFVLLCFLVILGVALSL
jgi:hypothetical protein